MKKDWHVSPRSMPDTFTIHGVRFTLVEDRYDSRSWEGEYNGCKVSVFATEEGDGGMGIYLAGQWYYTSTEKFHGIEDLNGWLWDRMMEDYNSVSNKSARKSKICKDIGDSMEIEPGLFAYVSEGHWNWHFKQTGENRYEVIFLNGGFIGGEKITMAEDKTWAEATQLADELGIRFSMESKSTKKVRTMKKSNGFGVYGPDETEYGVYSTLEQARSKEDELKQKGVNAFIVEISGNLSMKTMKKSAKKVKTMKSVKKKVGKSKVEKGLGLQAEVDYEVDVNIYDASGNYIDTCERHDISGFSAYDKLNEEITAYVNKYPQDFDLLDKSARKSKVKKYYSLSDMEDERHWTCGVSVPDGGWYIKFGLCDATKPISLVEIAKSDPSFWEQTKQELINSAKKNLNKTKAGKTTMTTKKSKLLKEMEELDDCEGEECDDKKEPKKEPLTDGKTEEGDEIRERCKSTKKGANMRRMRARKGMRKAEEEGTEVDEVRDPEEITSGGESAEPKETIVDDVEDPEEHDKATHGEEPEGTEVDDNVDPEEIEKLRRAKIRRALAKRRMQKSREARTVKLSPMAKARLMKAHDVRKARPTRKMSVTAGGSERRSGRESYDLSPMMREAVARSAPQEDEVVKSLNKRLAEIRSESRNGVTNIIGKKRVR